MSYLGPTRLIFWEQRDILAQTLIEATLRDRQFGLATNLVNERLVHKPFSPLSQRFKNKLG